MGVIAAFFALLGFVSALFVIDSYQSLGKEITDIFGLSYPRACLFIFLITAISSFVMISVVIDWFNNRFKL